MDGIVPARSSAYAFCRLMPNSRAKSSTEGYVAPCSSSSLAITPSLIPVAGWRILFGQIQYNETYPDMSISAEMTSQRAVNEAVRKLRGHFEETQQEFAHRLETAMVTIARWETSRVPSGKALERLHALAQAARLAECAEVFRQALNGDVERASRSARAEQDTIFQNARERALALALLTVLRNPENYGEIRKFVESTLMKGLDEYRECFKSENVDVRTALAVISLRGKGVTPEQMAEHLDMEVETVERVLTMDRFGLIPRPQVRTRATKATNTTAKRRKRVSAGVKRSVRNDSPSHVRRRSRGLSEILEDCLVQRVCE